MTTTITRSQLQRRLLEATKTSAAMNEFRDWVFHHNLLDDDVEYLYESEFIDVVINQILLSYFQSQEAYGDAQASSRILALAWLIDKGTCDVQEVILVLESAEMAALIQRFDAGKITKRILEHQLGKWYGGRANPARILELYRQGFARP